MRTPQETIHFIRKQAEEIKAKKSCTGLDKTISDYTSQEAVPYADIEGKYKTLPSKLKLLTDKGYDEIAHTFQTYLEQYPLINGSNGEPGRHVSYSAAEVNHSTIFMVSLIATILDANNPD